MNIPWPTRKTLAEKVLARVDEIKATRKTQAQWAEELGISQARIHVLFNQLGLQSSFMGKGRKANHHKKISEYQKILAHLQTHGGYTPDAIKALGLKTPPQDFRDFAKSIGIDLSHYQFAWREYGLWMTLPGPFETTFPANYLVPAVCRGCGTRQLLNIQNASTGKSNSCITCARQGQRMYYVVNAETGERFDSIRKWARAIGKFNYYQKLRIQLLKDRELEIDGIVYKLREK